LQYLKLPIGQCRLGRSGFGKQDIDQRLRYVGADVYMAANYISNGLQQIATGLGFDHVASYAVLERSQNSGFLSVPGEEHGANVGHKRMSFASRTPAVFTWHVDVEDRNIGAEFPREPDGLVIAVGIAHNPAVAIAFQKSLYGFPHNQVGTCKQNVYCHNAPPIA
jgi:hypothetical protein